MAQAMNKRKRDEHEDPYEPAYGDPYESDAYDETEPAYESDTETLLDEDFEDSEGEGEPKEDPMEDEDGTSAEGAIDLTYEARVIPKLVKPEHMRTNFSGPALDVEVSITRIPVLTLLCMNPVCFAPMLEKEGIELMPPYSRDKSANLPHKALKTLLGLKKLSSTVSALELFRSLSLFALRSNDIQSVITITNKFPRSIQWDDAMQRDGQQLELLPCYPRLSSDTCVFPWTDLMGPHFNYNFVMEVIDKRMDASRGTVMMYMDRIFKDYPVGERATHCIASFLPLKRHKDLQIDALTALTSMTKQQLDTFPYVLSMKANPSPRIKVIHMEPKWNVYGGRAKMDLDLLMDWLEDDEADTMDLVTYAVVNDDAAALGLLPIQKNLIEAHLQSAMVHGSNNVVSLLATKVNVKHMKFAIKLNGRRGCYKLSTIAEHMAALHVRDPVLGPAFKDIVGTIATSGVRRVKRRRHSP